MMESTTHHLLSHKGTCTNHVDSFWDFFDSPSPTDHRKRQMRRQTSFLGKFQGGRGIQKRCFVLFVLPIRITLTIIKGCVIFPPSPHLSLPMICAEHAAIDFRPTAQARTACIKMFCLRAQKNFGVQKKTKKLNMCRIHICFGKSLTEKFLRT